MNSNGTCCHLFTIGLNLHRNRHSHFNSLADRSVIDLSSFNKYFIDMAIEPAGPDDVLKSYAKDALPVIRT